MSETISLLETKARPQTPTWRSYYELTRLHKFPTGTLVLFFPCTIGLTMAAYANDVAPRDLAIQTAAYFVGSTLAHVAACVLNDIFDRDFDRQVERTKDRPLASGAVSVSGAIIFLLFQVAACLIMLSFTNSLAFKVGLFGIFPLHALYPLMKRWTNWPQAWLGLAMNWGLPLAWVSSTGLIEYKLLAILFFGTCSWTIVYDTIYGCQDKKDDVKAGVKSTSLLFGDYVRPILSLFAAHFVLSLAYGGILNGQGPAYFATTVGGAAVHFIWQLSTVDFDDPNDCWAKFKSNGHLGYILWAGLLVDYYVKVIA